jgi:chromosome partitioning protein
MAMVIAVLNAKGGTSKTTSSAYIAHVLHERGRRTLLVDADRQGSLMRWQEDADLPVSVIGLASPTLDARLPGIVGRQWEAVVIDTPPDDPAVIRAAVRAASHVVIPMAPGPAEHERIDVVRELLNKAISERRDAGPVVAVLLTRTPTNPRAVATRVYRELITEDGFTVLDATVKWLQRFGQAYGSPIVRAAATPYGAVVDELLALPTPSSAGAGAQDIQEDPR